MYLLGYLSEAFTLVAIVFQKFTVDLWFDNEEGSKLFFIYCALITICLLSYGLLSAFQGFLANKLGICVCKAINGLLLDKIFTLSHEQLSEISSGKILALVAQDSDYVMDYFHQISRLSQAIVSLVFSNILLLLFIGPIALYSLIGQAVPFILMPFQQTIIRGLRVKQDIQSDKRV